MKLLADRVALVTGAAAGIGAGIARLFAQHGARVYVTDKNGAGATAVADSIRENGGAAVAFEVDVRNSDSIAKTVDHALGHSGRLDILINNAGVYPRQSFLGMTEEQWDAMQDINLKSVFHCTRLVLPSMVERRSGHIVNISSVTFFLGMRDLSHYVATKGAMIGFTRSLAREVGEYNVHVNCITPGAVETEGEKVTLTQDQIAAMLEMQSLKRRITPLDIARVCLFLCSELSDAMTGQTLNVDGGWVMY